METVPAVLRNAQLKAYDVKTSRDETMFVENVLQFLRELVTVATDYRRLGELDEKTSEIAQDLEQELDSGSPLWVFVELEKKKKRGEVTAADLADIFEAAEWNVRLSEKADPIRGAILQMMGEMCAFVEGVSTHAKDDSIEKVLVSLLEVRDSLVILLREDDGMRFYRVVSKIIASDRKKLTR